MFKCDKCGECCKNLDKSPVYSELDRGDGTCKYLIDNVCSIYNTRPLLCRIDDSYRVFFKDIYSIDEYYKLNYEACLKLKEIRR
jgi:Fe-S-cluster containining protein